MPSIESFLKLNVEKINFIKWFVLPILLAAIFFFLDGRYMSKDEWKSQSVDQKNMIMALSIEQKTSFANLTKAITSLTEEQRNAAEFQHNNSAAIATLFTQLNKHELSSDAKWDKTTATFEKFNLRMDIAESNIARHEVFINKSNEAVSKIFDRVNGLETTSAKHEVGIQMNAEAIKQVKR